MRVGVLRGDLPGPVFIGDLEPVSQYNPPVEPKGQERWIDRPKAANIEAVLANATYGAGATIEGADLTGLFPLTINAGNHTLMIRKLAADAFATKVVANAAYADLPSLLAAINTALLGTGIVARQGTGTGLRVALESSTYGVASRLEIDTVAHGCTITTPLGFTDGAIRTMPAASLYITACLPVGGPIDVRAATINGVGAVTNANALNLIPAGRGTATAVADAIAPRFVETVVAIESFQVGMLSEYRNALYNPDPNRHPAFPNAAAIAVVQDSGNTLYTAPVPSITSAILGGALTISGFGLGNPEQWETTVKFSGNVTKTLQHRIITSTAGGIIGPTSIVIPAVLLPVGAAATVTSVQVKFRTLASNVQPLA